MIELKEGMSVFTPSGQQVVGKINRFVLDPVTKEVTHVVIQKGWLLPEDKVLPFQMVTPGTGDRIVLKEEAGNPEKLPPFEEKYFVRAEEEAVGLIAHPTLQSDSTYYWYPAYERENPVEQSVQTHRNIPENKILLKEGAHVISADGEHVGDIERLLVEPDSNKATHFLISQGLLFKDRKLIPAHWVKTLEEDKVHLAVPSRLLEHLPSYKS
jgi:Uncharacterized protein conserved in bacteria